MGKNLNSFNIIYMVENSKDFALKVIAPQNWYLGDFVVLTQNTVSE